MTSNANHSESDSTQLPALLPSTTLLIRRTQTTLGLLRDVVQESSAEYWYEQGKKANTIKLWEEAVSAFRACVAHDPNHWRATLQMATSLTQQQREIAAETLCQAYDLPYLEWDRWVSELAFTDWQLLRIYFEANKDTDHDKYSVLLALALVYRAVNETALARQIMDAMQSLCIPQIALSPAWYRLSGSLWCDIKRNNGDPVYSCHVCDEADVEFEQSAALSKLAANYYSLGIAKEDAGLSRFFFDDYKRAIKIDQYHAYANYKIGDAYSRVHSSYQDALRYYERAIGSEPNLAVAYLGLSDCQSQLGDETSAIASCKRAIELDPYLVRNKNYGSYSTYKRIGDSGFIAAYDLIIGEAHTNATDYYERGESKLRIEDYDGAIADFSKAIELETDENRLMYCYSARYSARYKVFCLNIERIPERRLDKGAIADKEKARELQALLSARTRKDSSN